MFESPRWSWTPRSTALVMTGVLLTAAWVAVGATMMLSGSTSSPTAVTPVAVTPSVQPTVVPKREVAVSRSKSRYNPKPYKGPLPKSAVKAPVAVAHPPQVETTETPATTAGGGAHHWPNHHWPNHGHHGGGHDHGGHNPWR